MGVKASRLRIVFIFYPWENVGGAIIRTTRLIKALNKYHEIDLLILPPRKPLVLSSLIEMLINLEKKNVFRTYFMSMKVSYSRLEDLNFSMFIKVLSSICKFLFKEPRSLRRHFTLYSRPPLYLILASALTGKFFGISSIAEIHHHLYADYRNPLLRFALKTLEWLTLSLSTYVVVNSEIFYSELRNGALKSRLEKVVLVRNCVNLEELAHLAEGEVNLGLKEKRDGNIIGFIGSLKAEEDITTLLRAFEIVQRSRSGTHLVIVGGGPMRRYYEKLTKVLGLGRHVTFLDERSHEEAMKTMKSLKVFVALRKRCQRAEVAVPLKVVDALALGIPVIATDLPSVREAVGDAAILVPPNDYRAVAMAILSLLDDPALRQALIERGKWRVVKLDCEKAILPLLQALSVIANAKVRGGLNE
jgi:glycosyltransferase involved in cell wall biosynthesis